MTIPDPRPVVQIDIVSDVVCPVVRRWVQAT